MMMNLNGNDPEFDATIGSLDFVLSKLMMYRDQARGKGPGHLSQPNRRTLKHHAVDMIAAARSIFDALGLGREGEYLQPEKTE